MWLLTEFHSWGFLLFSGAWEILLAPMSWRCLSLSLRYMNFASKAYVVYSCVDKLVVDAPACTVRRGIGVKVSQWGHWSEGQSVGALE